MCDWYLPRTSSRFLNSVGKIESGGITRLVSGKLRTAPKSCFPLPAAWHPPSVYFTHSPIAACPSFIFSNPNSTNDICPSGRNEVWLHKVMQFSIPRKALCAGNTFHRGLLPCPRKKDSKSHVNTSLHCNCLRLLCCLLWFSMGIILGGKGFLDV